MWAGIRCSQSVVGRRNYGIPTPLRSFRARSSKSHKNEDRLCNTLFSLVLQTLNIDGISLQISSLISRKPFATSLQQNLQGPCARSGEPSRENAAKLEESPRKRRSTSKSPSSNCDAPMKTSLYRAAHPGEHPETPCGAL